MNTIPQRFWNAIITATFLLVAFLAVLTIKEIKAIAYVGKSDQQVDTITVEGTGDAFAKPDIATFSFGVTETAKTVADAQTAATAKINAALKAVKDAGVADDDIQTTSYNINPHYEYQSGLCSASVCRPGTQVLTGYEVSQNVSVKVRDLSKAGDLFTAVGSLGVQNVNSLSFAVENPDSVQAQARSEAISKAEAKARELAKQLGVSLVRITNFSESSGGGAIPLMYATASYGKDMVAPQAAPQIPTGQQKVTSNISITYEIN